MNAAGGVGRSRMTGQAVYARMRSGAYTKTGIAVNFKAVGHSPDESCTGAT